MEICGQNNFCGGCIYQGMPYREQLELKGRAVLDVLKEKDISFEKYLGIEGAPAQYGYRNKMEYTFGNEVKDGEITLGLHKAEHYMSIITTDCCQLVHPDFNRVLRATLNFCVERGYSFYHKKSHKGLMRNLVLRRGVRTGELLVNIITSGQDEFDAPAYVALLQGLPLDNEIAGILHTLNDNPADAINGEQVNILYGRDYYMEEVLGLRFRVSAFSFFQTNVEAAERLYAEALALIPDLEGKTVFDLYCGTGTITQALALRAKQVVGVELVPEAVEAARANAALNGLDNCKFIAGDVLKVLDELEEKPDVIVVDPPRSGIHPKAMQKILNYGVKQIIYISCNPKSMAQNLVVATDAGYSVKTVKAYDNFPFTRHIEAVCLLSKVK